MLSELQASIKQQTIDAEQSLHEIKLEAERHLASIRQSETELSEHYGDIRDIKSVVGYPINPDNHSGMLGRVIL